MMYRPEDESEIDARGADVLRKGGRGFDGRTNIAGDEIANNVVITGA